MISSAALPRVLVTGGTGRIGTLVAHNLADRYALTLLDRRTSREPISLPFIQSDIADDEALQDCFHGFDTVVHLAADARHTAAWDSLFPNNVIGTRNVFQAAVDAGCHRIVYASSVHAVLGYPREVQVHSGMPACPSSLYGASKAWGEDLSAAFTRRYNVSVLCLRIGWLSDPQAPHVTPGVRDLDMVVTPRDLMQLIACCIDAPDHVRFGIFHGLSKNRKQRFDIDEGRHVLGYQPQDDAFVLARRNYKGILRKAFRKGGRLLGLGHGSKAQWKRQHTRQ